MMKEMIKQLEDMNDMLDDQRGRSRLEAQGKAKGVNREAEERMEGGLEKKKRV